MSTVLIIFAPILGIAIFVTLIVVSNRREQKKTDAIQKIFGHPCNEDFPIGKSSQKVTANFKPLPTRYGILGLSIEVRSIEKATFQYSEKRKFSLYEKSFRNLYEDEVAKGALEYLQSIGFESINLMEGNLTARWTKFDPKVNSFDDFSDMAAEKLNLVNQAVSKFFSGEDYREGARTNKKNTILLLVFFLVPLILLIAACAIYFSNYSLDSWSLLKATLLPAILLSLLTSFWIRRYVVGSEVLTRFSRWYIVTSSMGVASLCFILGCVFNIALPQLSSETRDLEIVRLVDHQSKGGKYYTARVGDWTHPGKELDFAISWQRYSFAQYLIRVTISRGALGYYWVSNYEYVPIKR
ncbi:MAG: hypothetical protein KA715_14320 [Xanthomonadaceae bacterium]|nr:hypothetical protein [Xanthomonadaceae bacterium]